MISKTTFMPSLVSNARVLLEFLNKVAFISNSYSLEHLGKDVSSSISNTTVGSWRSIRESTGCTKRVSLYGLPKWQFLLLLEKNAGPDEPLVWLAGEFLVIGPNTNPPNNFPVPLPPPPFGRLYGKGKTSIQKSFLLKTQHSTTK